MEDLKETLNVIKALFPVIRSIQRQEQARQSRRWSGSEANVEFHLPPNIKVDVHIYGPIFRVVLSRWLWSYSILSLSFLAHHCAFRR